MSRNAASAVLDDCDMGAFYGGTIDGVTRKIRDRWFTDLGVNTILISPIFEQIAGWVPSAGKDFCHYAYHGYFTLDYTVMDRRFGNEADLRDLVDCAHAVGIRVLLDVVLNHPGYPEPSTFRNVGISGWDPGWEAAEPKNFYDYMNRSSSSFNDWWGPDWVRCDLPGYSPGGCDDYTMLLHGLPDFKTEDERFVSLPIFLRNKADTRAMDMPDTTVRGYLVKWLSDWVREYGFDGFRCDSARHVEPETWAQLKHACVQAKREWWEQQRDRSGATPHFWLLGEVFGHGVERSSYFDCGFDSLLNFSFQEDIERGIHLDALYEDYAAQLHEHSDLSFVSYVSSHDTHLLDRRKIREGSAALMLAPGGVLLFYGDETGRLPGAPNEQDPAQAARSPMNWGATDAQLLMHWRKLSRFRTRHPAVANGVHLKLFDCPYVFARLDTTGDRVLVAMAVDGYLSLPVGEMFADGQQVRDAYGGWRGVVKDGRVSLNADGFVLLETDDGSAWYPDMDCRGRGLP
ncbi:glycosidase [Rhodanobacter denitrificans]|uniref:Glycosidase n=2 Tax=Rhodanobacter denitrificans TaxID=666685 RepID=M4NKN1_9GAMM|nr:glycosidase [Rhodanobacter denitrificans]